MPVIESRFRSPWWLMGGDLQTQLPVFLRWNFPKGDAVVIPTKDGDQLSARLYKSSTPAKRLIILSHGLEGSNKQHYVLGVIRHLQSTGLVGEVPDVLAWNLRSCGDPENKTYKMYFSGCIDDLDDVVHWAEQENYQEIILFGYSLGGNITLKWLGEQGNNAIARKIKAACTASSTIDLASSVKKLDRMRNIFYRLFFVTKMKWRVKRKSKNYPGSINLPQLDEVNSFFTYDEYVSAVLNGFMGADDLHQSASAVHVLDKIAVPCLLLQARNDPFLDDASFPIETVKDNPLVTLEISQTGGHVGYLSNQYRWYQDERFVEYLTNIL
jgi:uncharacterized protein